jgi:hypothetical protein
MNAENPNINQKLNIEELRAFPGCEHYNDQECEEIIESIFQISMLLFDMADWKKSIDISNVSNIVPFTQDNDLNIAA